MKCKLLVILATLSLWVTAPAHAAVITWILDNVAFDDGGTASGFFTLDPAKADSVSNFDIVTTRPGLAFSYTPLALHPGDTTFDPNDGGASVVRFLQRDGLGYRVLRFNFVPSLAANGTTPVSVADFPPSADFPANFPGTIPGKANEFFCCDDIRSTFVAVGGSVKSLGAVVPEASQLVLIALGCGLLMLLCKRTN
jgi:hypothetical protein